MHTDINWLHQEHEVFVKLMQYSQQWNHNAIGPAKNRYLSLKQAWKESRKGMNFKRSLLYACFTESDHICKLNSFVATGSSSKIQGGGIITTIRHKTAGRLHMVYGHSQNTLNRQETQGPHCDFQYFFSSSEMV